MRTGGARQALEQRNRAAHGVGDSGERGGRDAGGAPSPARRQPERAGRNSLARVDGRRTDRHAAARDRRTRTMHPPAMQSGIAALREARDRCLARSDEVAASPAASNRRGIAADSDAARHRRARSAARRDRRWSSAAATHELLDVRPTGAGGTSRKPTGRLRGPSSGGQRCRHRTRSRRCARRGARYLVIPRTSFWWLEHYRSFTSTCSQRPLSGARRTARRAVCALESSGAAMSDTSQTRRSTGCTGSTGGSSGSIHDGERRPCSARMRGVRVTGYFSDESGWGAAGRGYVRALQHLGVPTRPFAMSRPHDAIDPTIARLDV